MVLGALGNKKSLLMPAPPSPTKSTTSTNSSREDKLSQEERVWAQEGAAAHEVKRLRLSEPYL